MQFNQLDEKENGQLAVLIDYFKNRGIGKIKAIKSQHIASDIYSADQVYMSCQTIRKLVGHIRANDMLFPNYILSSVHVGYWLSSCTAEMNGFIDQELNRMSNQYQNISKLHQRLRGSRKSENSSKQINLF